MQNSDSNSNLNPGQEYNQIKKQIIPIGGGIFTSDSRLLFEKYILDTFWQTRAKQKGLDKSSYKPKVCLIPTATGDWDYLISKFYKSFISLNCDPSYLSLFSDSDNSDIASFLLSQDIIVVTGGNTFSMMAVWKAWGIDKILKECWESGIILTGSSAGSICWFESGNTDSFGKELGVVECMGFLKASHSPHYNAEIRRRPHYQKMILEKKLSPGYAMDNFAGVHFVDQEPVKAIATKLEAKAFFVTVENGEAVEKPLQMEFLGQE